MTIKSKAIVLKNNLPKKKPPKYKTLVIPSIQSTNALTMDLKTKKVCCNAVFTRFNETILVELTNHYWPWNEEGEEVEYKIVDKARKNRDASRSKAEKKKKVFLKKLERTQKTRSEGLDRVAYNAKSVESFERSVE